MIRGTVNCHRSPAADSGVKESENGAQTRNILDRNRVVLEIIDSTNTVILRLQTQQFLSP